MQFLKTLFWVVVAVVMVLFARDNWRVVEVNLWNGLVADVKLPVLALFFFLLGFLPTLIMYRARLWSLKRRLDTQVQSGVGNGPSPVRPNPAPAPVRTSSAASERRPAEAGAGPGGREATDSKAWPAA
jgi:uncharacterized integral membrane protein